MVEGVQGTAEQATFHVRAFATPLVRDKFDNELLIEFNAAATEPKVARFVFNGVDITCPSEMLAIVVRFMSC